MTKLEALTIYFGGQAHSPLNNTLIIWHSSNILIWKSKLFLIQFLIRCSFI
jgi:hypothetical protein